MKNLFFFRYLIMLRSSYWFIPMLMIGISIALAAATVQIDRYFYLPESVLFNWISNMGPGGARAVFATIAGSTITVAGTIFSIAMVILVMASSQFGPRLIPTFMRVGKIQFGIGIFVGTFVYCLLLLTFVPAENKGELLPVCGIFVGLALGIMAFLVLIMLIHEIATFIQAPIVAQRVSEDIINTFERVFPKKGENRQREDGVGTMSDEPTDAAEIISDGKGYVVSIDFPEMVAKASEYDAVVFLKVRPGDYVIPGQVIALVDTKDGSDVELGDPVREQVALGHDRNLTQDAQYAVDQMVEVAVRALSPGVNDPFTAINCIDKLGSALAYLSGRRLASRIWSDDEGQTRVVAVADSYEQIVEAAFGQIRHHAVSEPRVLLRLVDCIGRLSELQLNPDFRRALEHQLDVLAPACGGDFPFAIDKERLLQRHEEVTARLNSGPKPLSIP